MQSSLTHHSTTRKSIEVVVPAAEVREEFGVVPVTVVKAGPNVGVSKDHSLYALVDGNVKFDPRRIVSVISVKK